MLYLREKTRGIDGRKNASTSKTKCPKSVFVSALLMMLGGVGFMVVSFFYSVLHQDPAKSESSQAKD